MTEPLSSQEQKQWRTFLSANVQLLEKLDHNLQQRSNLSLTDYEILSMLAGAKNSKLRMSDLARQVLVSRSRLTYRVDRLVQANYLDREECEDDRRGLWAILTESGATALASATPGHEIDIRNLFFNMMDEAEQFNLARTMTRIDDKLSANR